jgi:hypothetical protein
MSNLVVSLEVTILKLRTLFDRQILVRLAELDTALICTTKWRLFSIIRRIGVGDAGRDFAPPCEKRLDSPSGRVREAISRV